jgi:hypothetical protein
MLKQELSVLGNVQNVISVQQNLVDAHTITSDEKELFITSLNLFSNKNKSHIMYPYVKKHIDNNFIKFDIVRMSKYALPITFNYTTKKVLINITSVGKRSIANIEPRDLFTLTVYGHSFANLILNSIPSFLSEYCIDYMSSLFLKVFAKKFGLTGSYFELIPELRYILSVYMLVSFFDILQKTAYVDAVKTSRFNLKKSDLKLDSYDFTKLSDFIKCLNKSGTLPGMNAYYFISTMSNNFSTINLPMFEDFSRFGSILLSSTVNQNSIATPRLRFINEDLYDRIIKGLLRLL